MKLTGEQFLMLLFWLLMFCAVNIVVPCHVIMSNIHLDPQEIAVEYRENY